MCDRNLQNSHGVKKSIFPKIPFLRCFVNQNLVSRLNEVLRLLQLFIPVTDLPDQYLTVFEQQRFEGW